MKKLWIVLAIAVMAVPLGAVAFVYLFPGTAYRAAADLERDRAGLSPGRIRAAGHDIVFLEGGRGETLLLVHGFNGQKDHWTRMARHLTPKYRVVIPDLPGFGESSRRPDARYTVSDQAARLKSFCDALNLDRVHIAGNSMGGAISGLFALDNPERVRSLGLVNAAGTADCRESEFLRLVEKGENPLIADRPGDMRRIMDFVFEEPPYIPGPVLTFLGRKNWETKAFSEKIFAEIRADITQLGDRLPDIAVPTLVLWGDRDRLIDVSCADTFHKGIPGAVLKIIPGCGHVPMVERPGEAARHYLAFLDQLP